MSDLTYRLIHAVGWRIYRVTARPTILHADRLPDAGGYLLASTHHSPYDVAGLMAFVPRPIDFLSIVEFRDKPVIGPFFRAMNCVFLDRRRRDPAAVRAVLDRLAAGRVVALFPEGNIRTPATSATAGGPFNPGVTRLAQMSGRPIVPVVMLNTIVYGKVGTYLPLRAARIGCNFGTPIDAADPEAARAQLAAAYVNLSAELRHAMGSPGPPTPATPA